MTVWVQRCVCVCVTLCCHGSVAEVSDDVIQVKIRVWKLDGEVEKVLWNHLKPEQLLVSYLQLWV